jgi:ABC-type glutathione transport system ATPase component
VVRLLCDRVIVMRRGESSSRVVRTVLGDPQDAYTKELLTAIRIRRCRFIEKLSGSEMACRTADDFIDAVSKALALPVEDAWRLPCGRTSKCR